MSPPDRPEPGPGGVAGTGHSYSSGTTCPEPEQLAAYVDGQLSRDERQAIEAHLEQCDDCLELISETARAAWAADDAAVAEPPPPRQVLRGPGLAPSRWATWGAVAAAAAVVIMVVRFLPALWPGDSPETVVASLREASRDGRNSPGRLAGFAHAPLRSVTRSGSLAAIDQGLLEAAQRAEPLVGHRTDAASLHAWGIAQLLIGRMDGAITTLESAVRQRPRDPAWLSDLAAAYLARGTGEGRPDDLSLALTLTGRALSVDPSCKEALFNRAVTLEAMGRAADAEQAFQAVVLHDPSPWGAEAAARLSGPPAPR